MLREGLPKERLTTRAAPVEDATSDPPIYRVVTFDLEPNLPHASDYPRDDGVHKTSSESKTILDLPQEADARRAAVSRTTVGRAGEIPPKLRRIGGTGAAAGDGATEIGRHRLGVLALMTPYAVRA